MKRLLKGILKAILVLAGLMIAVIAIVYFVYNEKVPVGKNPQEADALAYKMLNAINQKEYQDTRYLEWSFAGGSHRYKWDKQKGLVVVKWDDYRVNLNLNDTNLSEVTKNNTEVTAKEARDAFNSAWEYFNNDSFWLVAPFKIFDKGTTRSLVTLDDETQGLMITYSSGGTTPGDSYVWKLKENGMPISYKMWVKIIPIGGLEATWDHWKTMENGVLLPTSHKIGPITLSMGEVSAYN